MDLPSVLTLAQLPGGLTLAQLLFAVGILLVVCAAVGAKGTIKDITVDLSKMPERGLGAAVGALVLVFAWFYLDPFDRNPRPTPEPTPTQTRPVQVPLNPAPTLQPASATPQLAAVTTTPTTIPLAVQIRSPSSGDQVGDRVVITGRRTGLQQPDQHLWLMIHPQGDNNWWPHPQELIPDADGWWEVAVNLGGPPASRHDLVIGVVDVALHRAIVQHISDEPEEPLRNGLPAGFNRLEHIILVKAGP
jgi:hypothetical protein